MEKYRRRARALLAVGGSDDIPQVVAATDADIVREAVKEGIVEDPNHVADQIAAHQWAEATEVRTGPRYHRVPDLTRFKPMSTSDDTKKYPWEK